MRYRAPTPGVALLAASAVAILTITAVVSPSIGSSWFGQGSTLSNAGVRSLDDSSSSGPSLSNGVVRLNFHNLDPVFTLASVNDSRVATISALYGIAEVSPNGTVVSFASFTYSHSAWTFHFSNSTSSATLVLNASLPVAASQTQWNESEDVGTIISSSLGTVNVTVGFSLNSSVLPHPALAHVWVNATHWPWSNNLDSLGLELGLRASQSTRIEYGDTQYNLVESNNGTGGQVASFMWGRTATVQYGTGSPQTSVAGSFRSVASDNSNSTVRLMFSGVSGGYTSISYDPYLALNLSAFTSLSLPTWVFTTAGLVAILAGGAVAEALALVALWRRQVPLDPS